MYFISHPLESTWKIHEVEARYNTLVVDLSGTEWELKVMVQALTDYKIWGNLLSLSICFMIYKMGVLILAPPTLEGKTDV